jgi:hypothetical protein
LIAKLKISSLKWAVNRCCSQLKQPSQHLSIKVTNKGLAPSECGIDEKKIVIGSNEISIYEHYSEPGNPFLRHSYGDFRYFMRTWLKPVMFRAVDDFLITIPEYRYSYEKAKATGNWMSYFHLTLKDREVVENAFRQEFEKLLDIFQMRLIKLLLFGRYNHSFRTLSQELLGEWIDSSKLRYVFSQDGFVRHDNDQPKEFSYQIHAIGNRHLSLNTICLSNNIPQTITLYFFDDGKTLEYSSGGYSTVCQRQDSS